MRSALVYVQGGSDNIVAAECVARPLYVVGNPLVELAAVDDFLHIFVVGGHNQVEAPNLPVGDFAGNPCIGYAVFDSRRKPGYPVGILPPNRFDVFLIRVKTELFSDVRL